jgi:hypothetical protein
VETTLYLDTARLGRMVPGAQLAYRDFLTLAGEEGGSPLLERFLLLGARAWPAALRARYPGLSGWGGVGPLKRALRALAGGLPDLPVLLAARSAQLMKLAARLLFLPCRNVLVADAGWPGYHEILEAQRARASRAVTVVAVRDPAFRSGVNEDELVALVAGEAARGRCDGIFLPAVSSDGLRLPTERIVRAVEARQEVRFVVIDGAQEFCQAGADLRSEYCDLYLAGCHKWLGAYHPLGVALYGRRRSRGVVETVTRRLLESGALDDPLLVLSTRLEAGVLDVGTETVNLAPFISCQGAVGDALGRAGCGPAAFDTRAGNLLALAEAAPASGWRPVLPDPALRSGILLLEPERSATRLAPPGEIRWAFQERGVALTAYPGGLIRLSMPATTWRPDELGRLAEALRAGA